MHFITIKNLTKSDKLMYIEFISKAVSFPIQMFTTKILQFAQQLKEVLVFFKWLYNLWPFHDKLSELVTSNFVSGSI